MNSTSRRDISWYALLAYYFAAPWMYLVEGFPLSQVLGGVVLLCFGAVILVRGRLNFTPFHGWLTVWVLWCALSQIWAIDPERSWPAMLGLLKCYLLVVATWHLARTPEDYQKLAGVFVLGLLGSIVFTMLDYQRFVAGTENLLGVRRWRYSGAGYDPNTFSVVTSATFALAIQSAIATRSVWLKCAYLLLVPVGWYAVMLSGSRTGFVCCLFATTLLLAFRFPAKRTLIVGGGLAALTLVSAGVFNVPIQSIRRVLGTAEAVQTGDLSYRLEIWQAGIEVFFKNFVTGVGWANFDLSMISYFYKPFAAHNALLNVAAETGIVGLLLFGLAFYSLGIKVWLFRNWHGNMPAISLSTLFLGLMTLTFGSQQSMWVLIILNAGLCLRSGEFSLRSQPQVVSVQGDLNKIVLRGG